MKRIGIKVDNLRKIYGREDMTAEKWLEDSNNVYIGRYVRIFIKITVNVARLFLL